VVFGFFAVVGKGHIPAQAGQLDGHGRTERNAFVRRTKNHVELDTTVDQCFCIELGQLAQLGAVVKQACIEKVRAHAAGFGFELAKAQHARRDCKLHKFLRQRACGWRVA
jgi:hypothetical protein